MCSGNKRCLGGFIIWMDQKNSFDVNKFRSILNTFGLKIHVNKAANNLGHTLDLVTVRDEKSLVGSVNIERLNKISNHMLVN